MTDKAPAAPISQQGGQATSEKVTIPEMVALREQLRREVGLRQAATVPARHYAAAVTAAERLAKALKKLACGECAQNEARAVLDDLYPNWREVL